MSFGGAYQQGTMVGSNYILNIIELQNVITSASGLSPIEQVQNEVAALQTMVNVDQKRIFTNIISKFDQSPIQVTDDINLSNASLYQNGILFSGGAISGGGTTTVSSGGTSIVLVSTTSEFSTAIGFQVGGRTVFSFDGQGRALYYDPSGTGDRFWVSSATLIADTLQVGGSPTPGMFLEAISTTGLAHWNYVSTLRTSQGPSVSLSSGGIFFHTGNAVAQDAGLVDSNRNWYLGKPSLTGNTDLVSSNDFTVIGGKLRYQGGGVPVAGKVLTVVDALGTVALSNVAAGSVSSFVVGDQIQSGATSARADGVGQFVAFTQGASEIARFTGSGRLGIQTSAPSATLDVNGSARIAGNLTIQPGTAAAGYVFTATGVGGTGSWQPTSNLVNGPNQWAIDAGLPAFQGILNGTETIRLSTSGGVFGVNGPYSLRVNGTVAASAFASLSPLRFVIGATGTQVATVLDNGNFGIGTSTPLYKLHVAGSQSNEGSLYVSSVLGVLGNGSVAGTLTAGFFSGDGSNVFNIRTTNVGSGSNRLDTFQATTRFDITSLKIGLSTLSTSVFSTLYAYTMGGGVGFYSTLSSYLTQTSNSLSAAIGPGAGAVVSTYSTSVGIAMGAQFSTLSSYIVTNTSQFSTLSSMLYQTSVSDRAYASTISYRTTSSFFSTATLSKTTYFSSIAVGYKGGKDVSGTIDTNGLVYSAGLRGLSSPFSMGVGTSTTLQLIGVGYTAPLGWHMSLQGDLDISGRLFRNGQLYTVDGVPDVYWSRNGTSIWYADGNVGIGTSIPSYPLDVAGRIRCYGVDVIPGPGPATSTPQGYTSPWQYQSSNIFYNLGGVGMGVGISSVRNGVMLDVSGPVRIRNGPTYISSLAVNIPYGSTLVAGVDLFASVRARSLVVDSTGTFAGRVTARDFLSLSDARFKKDICLISDPDVIVSSIRGVRFAWKDSEKQDVGLLAQEVIRVLPEAVEGDLEQGLRVSYDKLVPVLLESLKQLQRRVTDLESLVSRRP